MGVGSELQTGELAAEQGAKQVKKPVLLQGSGFYWADQV